MLTLDRLDIDSAASLEDANHLLYRMGLTDGLPVVPPTRERVAAMLGNRDPERVVATLPPMQNRATARNLAACAVMAGCRPMDFDVLKAATAAVAEPEFNLFGIQTTTGAATPMLIVNGPVVHRLGLNAGANALGPGTRANASIGRALQFVLRTIGGADPGRGDKATMGQPGKFTLCCAENALDSPWEPLHVNRGFLAEQSTVTVVGAVGTVEVVDAESADAQGVLTTMARSMTIAGNLGKDNLLGSGEPLLLVAPEHAGIIGRTHTRRQAQGVSVSTGAVAGRFAGSDSGGTTAQGSHHETCCRGGAGGHLTGGRGRAGSQIDVCANVGRRDAGGDAGC